MSRKKQKHNRIILADAKYKSTTISKFINKIMKHGKKSVAKQIVYDVLEKLSQELNEDGLKVFSTALKNVTPLLEVKSRRVGGSTYQVPVEVRSTRGISLAMRWIIANSRKRSGRPYFSRVLWKSD